MSADLRHPFSHSRAAVLLLCLLLVACSGGQRDSKKKVSAFLTGRSQSEENQATLQTPAGLTAATTQELFDLRRGITNLELMTSSPDAATTAAMLQRELNAFYQGTLPAREVAARAYDLGTSLELATSSLLLRLRKQCESRLREEEDLIAQLIQAGAPTRAPDQFKSLQDRFEAILAAFYEKQYSAVLDNLETLTSETQKLIDQSH
jgi:hypothetical protein